MTIADGYRAAVRWIGDGTGLPDTILHIHGGLAVLMIARLASGRSLRTFLPLASVVVAEALKEVLDRLAHGSWRWADTSADIVNSLFWPLVITLAVRCRPVNAGERRPERGPLDDGTTPVAASPR